MNQRSPRRAHMLRNEMNRADAVGSRIRIQQLLTTTLFLLAACEPQVRDESAAADSFYLSVSRGGGITGMVTGCDFNSAGRVRKWRASASGATDSLITGMLPVTSIQERLPELTALPSPDRSGNLTYRVVLTRPDETRVWTWATNHPLTEWYRVTRKMCATAAQDADNTTER